MSSSVPSGAANPTCEAAEPARDDFAKFFLLSPEPMAIADPFGCFKRVNPAFARLTGFDEAELVSRPFMEFVLPADRERTAREMELQVAVRPSIRFENHYVRKDGALLLLSWTAYFDKDDGVTYATAFDITDRRLAERELARLRAGVDRSNDAIFMTGPDGAIHYVNRAFEELYGFTAAEAIGKTPRILRSGLTTLEFYAEFWRTLLAKQIAHGRLVNKTKDGRLLQIDAAANPILDEDGQLLGFLAIQRDVTERERADAERSPCSRALEARPAGALGYDGCTTGSCGRVSVMDARPLVLVALFALPGGCKQRPECGWETQRGPWALKDNWTGCSDGQLRSVECRRTESGYQCQCMLGGVAAPEGTVGGKAGAAFTLPSLASLADRESATRTANELCVWSLAQ